MLRKNMINSKKVDLFIANFNLTLAASLETVFWEVGAKC